MVSNMGNKSAGQHRSHSRSRRSNRADRDVGPGGGGGEGSNSGSNSGSESDEELDDEAKKVLKRSIAAGAAGGIDDDTESREGSKVAGGRHGFGQEGEAGKSVRSRTSGRRRGKGNKDGTREGDEGDLAGGGTAK